MKTSVLNSNSSDYGKQYSKQVVEAVTADKVLDADDSGKLFVVNPAATTALTLPAVELIGWNCEIVVTEGIAATDGSMNQIVNVVLGQGDNIGQAHEVAGGAGNFAVTGDDHFVFTAAATPGDRVEVISDGTQWIIQAYVKSLTDSDFSANTDTIA
jgi:nitrogen fixation/metabolism regulation signal transduction histidine kinase